MFMFQLSVIRRLTEALSILCYYTRSKYILPHSILYRYLPSIILQTYSNWSCMRWIYVFLIWTVLFWDNSDEKHIWLYYVFVTYGYKNIFLLVWNWKHIICRLKWSTSRQLKYKGAAAYTCRTHTMLFQNHIRLRNNPSSWSYDYITMYKNGYRKAIPTTTDNIIMRSIIPRKFSHPQSFPTSESNTKKHLIPVFANSMIEWKITFLGD